DRLELEVAIGMMAHRGHPQGLPLMKAVLVEQPINDMNTDITSALLHEIDDLSLGQIGPDQRLLGGAAGGVLDQDLAEVLVDLGIVLDLGFAPPAGFADPRLGSFGEIIEIVSPLADGLGIDAQDPRDILD